MHREVTHFHYSASRCSASPSRGIAGRLNAVALPYYVLPHFASARPCVALLSVAVAQLHRVAPLIAFTMNAASNTAFFELPSFYCPPLPSLLGYAVTLVRIATLPQNAAVLCLCFAWLCIALHCHTLAEHYITAYCLAPAKRYRVLLCLCRATPSTAIPLLRLPTLRFCLVPPSIATPLLYCASPNYTAAMPCCAAHSSSAALPRAFTARAGTP